MFAVSRVSLVVRLGKWRHIAPRVLLGSKHAGLGGVGMSGKPFKQDLPTLALLRGVWQ